MAQPHIDAQNFNLILTHKIVSIFSQTHWDLSFWETIGLPWFRLNYIDTNMAQRFPIMSDEERTISVIQDKHRAFAHLLKQRKSTRELIGRPDTL